MDFLLLWFADVIELKLEHCSKATDESVGELLVMCGAKLRVLSLSGSRQVSMLTQNAISSVCLALKRLDLSWWVGITARVRHRSSKSAPRGCGLTDVCACLLCVRVCIVSVRARCFAQGLHEIVASCTQLAVLDVRCSSLKRSQCPDDAALPPVFHGPLK